MISTLLMQALLVVYLVIAAVSLYEGAYARALYWVSAGTLTLSLIWMGR